MYDTKHDAHGDVIIYIYFYDAHGDVIIYIDFFIILKNYEYDY